MKYSALLLCLIAGFCNAEEVVTSGYGNTYEIALRNAKIAALEKATGTWISSEHSLRNGKFNEEIVQYNGGVIKKYEVINYTDNQVTIKADVDVVKDNRVGSKHANIPTEMREKLLSDQEKYDMMDKAVKYLSDQNRAFNMRMTNVDYKNTGLSTQVEITGFVTWIPKWQSDVKTFAETVNRKGMTKTNTEDRVVGAGVMTLMSSNPYTAIAAYAAYGMVRPKDKEGSDDPMVCFGTVKGRLADECYLTGAKINFYDIKLNVQAMNGKQRIFNKKVTFFDTNLYEQFTQGDSKRGIGGVKLTYQQPAFVIYKDEAMPVKITFDVPTQVLAQVDRFVFNF
jgi:hypothetical protein